MKVLGFKEYFLYMYIQGVIQGGGGAGGEEEKSPFPEFSVLRLCAW